MKGKWRRLWVFWLLLTASVIQCVAAVEAGRALQQSNCPVENCSTDPAACIYYRSRGFRCKQCAEGYVTYNGGASCECKPGRYRSVSGCSLCPVNYYCHGHFAEPKRCPGILVTAGLGASGLKSCANPPGYKYVPSSRTPTAVPCGRDSYSSGYRFQTECTQCPSGFRTKPDDLVGTHTSSLVCVAPPGFIMVSSMVAPCAKGTYSSDYTSNNEPCTKCSDMLGPGITTQDAGAMSIDACTYVEPGYAAVSEKRLVYLTGAAPGSIITTGKLCPQNYYCAGGSPYVGGTGVPQPCPEGMMTTAEGAISADECVAPPGHYVVPGSNPLRAADCPDGWYKDGWDRQSSCRRCGTNPYEVTDGAGGVTVANVDGWKSNETTTVSVLDPHFGQPAYRMMVRGSPDSCYLRRGMGSQRVLDNSAGGYLLIAMYCPTTDSYYGIPNDRYGMSLIPCFNCLPNMYTTCASVVDDPVFGPGARAACDATLESVAVRDGAGTLKAYSNSTACVMKPGWGWVDVTFGPPGNQQTRAFPLPCPVDTFSPGGAYNLTCALCTSIDSNYTTRGATGQSFCLPPP